VLTKQAIRRWLRERTRSVSRATAGRRTSISDARAYRRFCRLAAADPSVFATFRSAKVYREVLEHVDFDQGLKYLEVINRDSPHLLHDWIAEFRRNDVFGSPKTFEYPATGAISPTTLRYIKVLSDLERLFGDLSRWRVAEIGVGYAGQCRLIKAYWDVDSYALIDLEPTLELARTYLEHFGRDALQGTTFHPEGRGMEDIYDLCISNYAFTELARPVQQAYIATVVGKSRAGYMTCNFISEDWGIESMTADELLALHPAARWLPEEPKTHRANRILVWGGNR
jgi:hypothetical protein